MVVMVTGARRMLRCCETSLQCEGALGPSTAAETPPGQPAEESRRGLQLWQRSGGWEEGWFAAVSVSVLLQAKAKWLWLHVNVDAWDMCERRASRIRRALEIGLALDADPHLHTPPVARQHSEVLNIAEHTQCLVVVRVWSCLGNVCLGVSCTR